jgi:drug/metabolite transporter (DMT)-like permease
MPRFLTNPYLLLALTSLFWSGNMVVGRGIRGDVPPLTLAFGRWIIAFSCLLPFALPHLKTQWPLLRQRWKTVVFLGLLGIGGYNTFAYVALQHTSATNALLLNSFIPIATIAISWAFFGKRLRRLEALGIVLSLIGALTIVARGDFAALAHLNLNVGDLWMLVAVAVWAAYTAGLVRRPAGVDPMLLLTAFIAVGIVALAPFCAWEIASGRVMNVNANSLLALAYVGILPSFVGYAFYNRGVAEVGPNIASLFIHLMPVFGIFLSAVFLAEIPQRYHYAGIVMIFAGIGLTMKKA